MLSISSARMVYTGPIRTEGSRSARGAQAWAVLASLLRTARQHGRDVLATLKTLLMQAWAGEEPGFLASG